MTQGKGLESLIPKKQIPNNKPAPSPMPAPSSKPAGLPSYPHATGWNAASHQNVTVPFHDDRPRIADGGPAKPFPKPESVFHIEVEKIRPNPYQPRHEFNPQALEELAQSIREFGVIQPLVVTKMERESEYGTEVEYQLIAGERRLMASKIAGLERVPAVVRKVGDARTKLELALIENIQRSNLNPIESARAYARLQDEFGLTQREVAARVGKSREAVANTLRLLNLPLPVQQALSEGKINESHARALLSIENRDAQWQAFQKIISEKTTVRELRAETKEKTAAVPAHTDPQDTYWEKRLEDVVGAPVKVFSQGTHGKIVIQFYSQEEKRGIMERLAGDNATG